MTQQLEELFERVIAPLPGDNPYGENAKYDERYDKSKSEIMKLTAGSSSIDWECIVSNCDELLAEKTKDLMLVGYMGLALLKLHRYDGLAVGLKVLHHFIDEHWEGMFPPVKRARARSQFFEWMDERFSVLVSVTQPKPDEADAVRECQESANALPMKVQDKFTTQVTGFSHLRTEINRWAESLPEPEPEPTPEPEPELEPAEKEPEAGAGESAAKDQEPKETSEKKPEPGPKTVEPPASPEAASPKTAAAQVDVPSFEGELESLEQGIKEIIKIINLLREAQPLAPMLYRMARIAKWSSVSESPAHDAQGRTRIPEPKQQLNVIDAQLKAGNWVALINTAEHMFISGGGIFNMNLQNYVSQGLESQGAEEAARAVLEETGRFLLRMPEILDLTYDTGAPFADPTTQGWAGEAMKAAQGPGGAEEDGDDRAWLDEAKAAAQTGMAKALPVLRDGIFSATDTKNSMKRRLDVAKFFHSRKEDQWAVPILESLDKRIGETSLMEWEPGFCADVWETLLQGYEALQRGGVDVSQDADYKRTLRHKLFEVNVVKAAGVTPKKKSK